MILYLACFAGTVLQGYIGYLLFEKPVTERLMTLRIRPLPAAALVLPGG
ncbi:MAG TPA: hypothetical protein VN175_08830 [Rhizomicrobium sp.]|nr:hypothetical protein [Rhizomicrobium sp.]